MKKIFQIIRLNLGIGAIHKYNTKYYNKISHLTKAKHQKKKFVQKKH